MIEKAGGAEVIGYRAPSFSIVRKSLWALDVLAEEGFRYDASIYPIHHDTYGIPDWNPKPQWLTTAAGKILEIPCSTVRVFGINVPCGGGGYIRLLPFAFNQASLRRLTRTHGARAVIYIHPWEFDPSQPRIPAPFLSRFRHYTGLRHTEERIGVCSRSSRFGLCARRWKRREKLVAKEGSNRMTLRSTPASLEIVTVARDEDAWQRYVSKPCLCLHLPSGGSPATHRNHLRTPLPMPDGERSGRGTRDSAASGDE